MGPGNRVLGACPDPTRKDLGNFKGEKGPDVSDGRYTLSDSAGDRTSAVRMPVWSTTWGYIGATWRTRLNRPVRRRCGLMSNYSDRLFTPSDASVLGATP